MVAPAARVNPRHGPLSFVTSRRMGQQFARHPFLSPAPAAAGAAPGTRIPLVKREQLIQEAMQAEGHLARSTERRELLKGTFLTVEKADGLADRTIRIRITTGARDRQRDTIDPAGWQLSDFTKNPVVLYGHNYWGFPVARDMGITIDANGLVGTPRFTTAEENPEGDMTYRLLLGGYLNAASVGFQPEEWFYNEPERGIDYKKQSLLEYSIVPIPANPEALVEARSAGIDLAPMKAWAEQVLELEGGPGLWMPKSQVEQALRVITPRKLFIPVSLPADLEQKLAKELGPNITLEKAVTPPVGDGTGSPDILLQLVGLKINPVDAPGHEVEAKPPAEPAAPPAAEPTQEPPAEQVSDGQPPAKPAGEETEDELVEVIEQPAEVEAGLRFSMDVEVKTRDPNDPLFDLLEAEEPDLIPAGLLPDGLTPEGLKDLIHEAATEVLGKYETALTGRLD